MATTIPTNPTATTVIQLLAKVADPDPDFRFMALSDLLTVLSIGKQDMLYHDYNAAARTLDYVVRALDDTNGEVQNQAIKCLGPLVKKLPSQLFTVMMDKLTALKLKNSVDTSVPAMVMRAMVEALPRPTPGIIPTRDVLEAYGAVSTVLIPRLLGRSRTSGGGYQAALLDSDNKELSPDSVDVLIEVVRCFGPLLQAVEIEALHDAVVTLLEKDQGNSVVKKRAVVAVAMLAHYLSDDLLGAFINRAIGVLNHARLPPVTRRLYITILGSMARSIPHRFGRHLSVLVPLVLKALSEEELQVQLEEINDGGEVSLEFSEVREAALVALEAFLSSCPTQMRPFTGDAIEACLRYLKFDPNYAVDEDEEMEEEDEDADGFEDDDEFEADGGFDDDDDASWKARRCAAKALYTIISTRSSGDLLDSGLLYGKVAPALIKRFDEREENVRLEVLSAMSLLIRKTGEGIIPEFSIDSSQSEYLNQLPQSRKRRRQSSAGGASSFALTMAASDLSGTGLTSPTMEKIPATGPCADLAALTPVVVKSAAKLLKGKLIPTKQATINLLDDMVAVQRGGLAPYFDQVIGPIIDAIKSSSAASTSASLSVAGGNASATASTLRIAALRLTSDVVKNHSSAVLQPYLSKIVAGVVAVVHDRFYKISGAAIQTAEEVIKAITPPRSRLTAQKFKGELQKLYDVIIDRTTANDADAEVRQKAIHALGTLLSRTTGTEGAGLLSEDKRTVALGYLLDRLKNETTRLAAVRAVDTIAALSSSGVHYEPQWIQSVAVELAGQLRKANRALRGSSIMALKHLILSPTSKDILDETTIQNIVTALIPVITNNDAQLLGPGLLVLAHLTREKPKIVVTSQLIGSICELLKSNVAGSVLDSLLVLVTNVGQMGQGRPLMIGLLKDVGVTGEPSIVGKVIGTLLVASGNSAGVTMDSFVQEIKNHSGDQTRSSLALAVLGEAGLRLGPQFPLPPDLFLQQFSNEYDKVSLSAAVALGRAGAGNVSKYVPVILQSLQKKGSTQYLLLQSIKEVLQQAALSSADISEFSTAIWNQILAAADAEDNKAVCAECIGRMVIIDPKTYMTKLESLLKNNSPVLRAIAVQALRYTLPDENEVFDSILKTYLVDMLRTMLEDSEMEIRRHAMSTLNSASHNKPELILPYLNQLVPYVMNETVKKEELIREVQMGPFKHMIDDGLEVRKAAYETLYALMETAFSRISTIDLYDRIVAGLSDDNDIRALCNLMVSKLVYIDPDETSRRLDSIAEAFRKTLSVKLKDTAVKQELEKQDEANKAVLRVTILLGEKLKSSLNPGGAGNPAAGGTNQVWTNYWEWVNKDFDQQLKCLREESRETA
ncbi:Cullin-associated NEDD8-dissociated protein 1, C-terminal part [Diplogelasinospora grovesii]|uniref:Cullin-associated NEDD8-dissociated protein 1, C-terminal part n=1 Tax=Diplogelasinospora grovesii TaxID=303347 RepID=A0AAN6NHA9_9PEZI|nr:Cullin-associated NEDD8-dissociated protein 1, C-terminal part [Diplogelasinospora grovesii]